jgi:cytochrome oxidase Cu insertion factor (SCO1/SenC/PrrC family)
MRIAVVLLAAASLMVAQRMDVLPQPGSAGDNVVRMFEQSAPQVGTPFPGISIFDESGKPFHTSALRGRWTVLVSGCLT